jgi:hypothetical protein
MSDLKKLALRVATIKTLTDRIEEVDKDARAELIAAMQNVGASSVTPELPDGTKISSVSIAGGDKVTARVTDPDAFLRWVKSNKPAEVEERVRDSYKKKLLDEVAATGEEVPGVELGTSRTYLSNRFKTGGKDAIAEAWSNGTLQLGEVLALPMAGGED